MNVMKGMLFALALGFAVTGSAATTLKIATMAPEGTAWMTELRAAADTIGKATAGRVAIRYYPGGVMGDAATVLRKIKIGQLQGAALTGGEASIVAKDAQIYSLPFLFRDQAEVDAVRKTIDPMLAKEFGDAGFAMLGESGGGFAFLMSTRDIKSTADLKAAKVWVPQGDKIAEAGFSAAGITPIPLPLSDVYTGLQTGLVDTVANTPAGAIAFQWHTRLKYAVDMPLTYVMGFLIVDRKAFDSIDAADRTIVSTTIAGAFDRLDAKNRSDNVAAKDVLRQQGITFFEPDAATRAGWDSVGAKADARLTADGSISPEMFKALESALAAARSGSKP